MSKKSPKICPLTLLTLPKNSVFIFVKTREVRATVIKPKDTKPLLDFYF